MFRFLTLILLLACAFSASARTLTLGTENAGAYALSHNRSLAAARLRIDEARGRLQQSGRYANPELEASWTQNFRTAERSVEIGFTQRFPLTARLGLEKKVSQAELAGAEAEVRDEERKTVLLARSAIVRLLAIDAQGALRDRQLANSKQLSEFTRKRVETAEASVTDVTLIDLEARVLEAELLLLQVERAAILGELRPVVGIEPADDVTITGDLASLRNTPARSISVGARPDMQAARASVDAAQSASQLARAQKWQDVGVGLALQSEYTEDAPEGFERDEFWGLRFSLPLPLWDNNSGRIREADAAAARRRKEADALALTIRAEAAAARSEMAALASLINAMTDTLIPTASQVEEQLRTSYSSGQTPITEALRARDRRLLIERQRVDAQRDYHLARIRYDAAVGRGSSRPRIAPRAGK